MRGLITGKRAREYEQNISRRRRTKIFDKFILDNVRKKDTSVCDLCCGPGNVISILKLRVKEIVGVDGSNDMINIARQKFKKDRKVTLLVSAASKTRLKSSHFDYVIIRMGLHHIKEKSEVMKEIDRILKHDGHLIVIDRFYTNRIRYYLREVLMLLKGNPIIFSHFTLSKENNEEILSERFNITKRKYIHEPKAYSSRSFMYLLEKKI